MSDVTCVTHLVEIMAVLEAADREIRLSASDGSGTLIHLDMATNRSQVKKDIATFIRAKAYGFADDILDELGLETDEDL